MTERNETRRIDIRDENGTLLLSYEGRLSMASLEGANLPGAVLLGKTYRARIFSGRISKRPS
jgi:hypothetical protein